MIQNQENVKTHMIPPVNRLYLDKVFDTQKMMNSKTLEIYIEQYNYRKVFEFSHVIRTNEKEVVSETTLYTIFKIPVDFYRRVDSKDEWTYHCSCSILEKEQKVYCIGGIFDDSYVLESEVKRSYNYHRFNFSGNTELISEHHHIIYVDKTHLGASLSGVL